MESRLLAVESQVRQHGPRPESQPSFAIPYWSVIRLDDSVAITPTTFPEFDDTSRTDRAHSRHITVGGELFLSDWADKKPARASIAFDAKAPLSVLMCVLADPEVDPWWLSINGTVTAYNGSQHVTVSFRQGHNLIQVFKDFDFTNRLLIECILFDGDTSTWTPP